MCNHADTEPHFVSHLKTKKRVYLGYIFLLEINLSLFIGIKYPQIKKEKTNGPKCFEHTQKQKKKLL